MSLIALWIVLKVLFWIGLIAYLLFIFFGTSAGRETLMDVLKVLGGIGGVLLFLVAIGALIVFILAKIFNFI
tara:strand:- start:918 stop:1133 length:216 start_codon:yes stop_codon:yes gene_type:complete